jgi:hypothetical protein
MATILAYTVAIEISSCDITIENCLLGSKLEEHSVAEKGH